MSVLAATSTSNLGSNEGIESLITYDLGSSGQSPQSSLSSVGRETDSRSSSTSPMSWNLPVSSPSRPNPVPLDQKVSFPNDFSQTQGQQFVDSFATTCHTSPETFSSTASDETFRADDLPYTTSHSMQSDARRGHSAYFEANSSPTMPVLGDSLYDVHPGMLSSSGMNGDNLNRLGIATDVFRGNNSCQFQNNSQYEDLTVNTSRYASAKLGWLNDKAREETATFNKKFENG